MKSKVRGWLKTIGKGIFAGTLAMQCICALVWSIGNFGVMQGFSDVPGYVSGEIKGIYSLFVRLFHGSVYPIVILQFVICTVFVYIALAAFLRGLEGQNVPARSVLLGTVFLITNPFFFTIICSVEPYAFAAVASFVAISYGFLYINRIGEKGCISFLTVAILAVLCAYDFDNRYYAATVLILAILSAGGLIRVLSKPALRKNIGNILLPASVFLLFAVFMALTFRKIPYLTENSKGGFSLLKDICKGWFSFLAAPVMLLFKKYPFGDSLNPYLYAVLWQKKTSWTLFYFRSCAFGYAVFIFCGVILGIVNRLLSEKNERRKGLWQKIIFYSLLPVLSLILFLSGKTDYDFRLCLTVILLWGTAVIANVSENGRNELFAFGIKEKKSENVMKPKGKAGISGGEEE